MRCYLGDRINNWRLYGVRIGRVFVGVSVTLKPWGGAA